MYLQPISTTLPTRHVKDDFVPPDSMLQTRDAFKLNKPVDILGGIQRIGKINLYFLRFVVEDFKSGILKGSPARHIDLQLSFLICSYAFAIPLKAHLLHLAAPFDPVYKEVMLQSAFIMSPLQLHGLVPIIDLQTFLKQFGWSKISCNQTAAVTVIFGIYGLQMSLFKRQFLFTGLYAERKTGQGVGHGNE